MPFVYLVRIRSLVCNNDVNNYAIISKNKQEKIEQASEGDITNLFDPFSLTKYIIDYKEKITIDNNIFNEIISTYKKNSKIIVNCENNKYVCEIDNIKILLCDTSIMHPTTIISSKNIIYTRVGIYN